MTAVALCQIDTYLNRLDVQEAIHANTKLPYKWSECSSVLNYSRTDLLTSVLPVYEFLIQVRIVCCFVQVRHIVGYPHGKAKRGCRTTSWTRWSKL